MYWTSWRQFITEIFLTTSKIAIKSLKKKPHRVGTYTECNVRNPYTLDGDLLRKSLYSVGIKENTDQKKTPYLDTFHAVLHLRCLTQL